MLSAQNGAKTVENTCLSNFTANIEQFDWPRAYSKRHLYFHKSPELDTTIFAQNF